MSIASPFLHRDIYARVIFVFCSILAVALYLGIAPAQIAAFTASAMWIVRWRRDPAQYPARFTGLGLPILLFTLATLASTFASTEPLTSLLASREVSLFLVFFLFVNNLKGTKDLTFILNFAAAACFAISVAGLVQFGLSNEDWMHRRIDITHHYMTMSGLFMIGGVFFSARLLQSPGKKKWLWPAAAVVLAALACTLSRNAWIGLLVGLATLAFLYRSRMAFAVLVLVPVVAYLVSPGIVRNRLESTLDPDNPTARHRIIMIKAGLDMIRDDFLTGVGQKLADDAYRDTYHIPHTRDWDPARDAALPTIHLHNNLIQIGAERGVPALIFWIWIFVRFFADAFRRVWNRASRKEPEFFFLSGSIAAVLAFLAAGLFEYTFGDSVVLMAVLAIMSFPYCVTRT